MDSNPAVQHLLDTVAPLIVPLAMTPATDGQSWHFHHEEQTFFTLSHDIETDTLSFLAPVGKPGVGVETSVYEKLLVFSNQWDATGGLRFALEESSDELVLIYTLAVDRISSAQLVDIMGNLLEQQDIWKSFIEKAKDDTPPPELAPFNPAMMGNGIIRG